MKISVIEKRKIWYIISVVILLAGMVSMLVQGLNLGIDFVGGNKIAVQFEQQVDIADLRTALNENGLEGSKIQELDDGSFMLKTTELNQAEQDSLMADLAGRFGELEIVSSGLVGPSVGAELKKNAVIALALAVLLMIAYISYRFELHFAIAGVIRLVMPQLTQENRKDLVKRVKKKGEDAKVSVRNIRRDGNDDLKGLEKSKEITEDESKGAQDDIQKMTDKFIAEIDKVIDNKEKEIMTV